MIDINGHNIDNLPFEGLRKVSNLIEFDGPLLSHYKDKFDNSILFYWVDNNSEFNRWVVWQVKEDNLIFYLSGSVPLSGIFPENNNFVYVVDIDRLIQYKNIVNLYVTDLPFNYKPEADSYFKFELPEIYEEKTKAINYLKEWELSGLYFNVQPASNRYGSTVGIKDVWQVLQNICKSFSEYVGYNVRKILTEMKVNDKTILDTVKSLSSATRLRLIHLDFKSFHAGIAAENIKIDSGDNKDILEGFTGEVLKSFQNEVLNNDFSSPEAIDLLVKKYQEEESRRKIFNPIIEIINNSEITLNITDYSKEFDKSYKRVPTSEKVRLLPETKKPQEPSIIPEQVLVAGYYVADKVGDQISMFPKDKIMYGVRPVESIPTKIDSASFANGEIIKFNYSLDTEITFENGIFYLSFAPLSINLSSRKEPELINDFNDEFVKLYNEYLKGDKTYSTFFEGLISK